MRFIVGGLSLFLVALGAWAGEPNDPGSNVAAGAHAVVSVGPGAPGRTDTAGAPAAAAATEAERIAAMERRITALEQALAATRESVEAPPKTEGLIPHVLVGPKLSLITLPNPGLGLEVKGFRYFGVSFDYGLIPEFDANGVRVGMHSWRAAAKVYPGAGSFFLGVAYGSYAIHGKNTVSGATTTLDISSGFIQPEVGWCSVGSSGFFTLVELGWQFPTSYTSKMSGNDPGNLQDIQDNADKYLKHGMPLLGLLQIGWMF